MAESQKYEFTPEQETAIGQLVVENYKAHFQISIIGGVPVLYFSFKPDNRISSYCVHPDGTVVNRMAVG
jgi:hypothetical protein